MNIESGQEEYRDKATPSSEDQAREAINAARDLTDDSDWARMRRTHELLEAAAHAQIAVAEAARRMNETLEKFLKEYQQAQARDRRFQSRRGEW